MPTYAKNVLCAVSRVLAALVGFSGRFTLCAECGASRCRLCWWVRGICGVRHCVDASLDEGRLT